MKLTNKYTKKLGKVIILNLVAIFIIFSANNSVSAHDPKRKVVANKIFGKFSVSTDEHSEPIGYYAKGCLAGGEALPLKGTTWQVMNPSRNRNWGHIETIDFIKRLSRKATEIGWLGLYIGDISQPRGGPMPYGHKSHQIGLDVDIWLLPPQKLNLEKEELKKVKQKSIRSKDKRNINKNWTKNHMKILKAAALDPSVDRIFITAPAKIWMCQNAGVSRDWLQKIRPLGGHNKHFHVRLKCPPTSAHCVSQNPSISNLSQTKDGCDHTLKWWVTKALEPYKKQADPQKEKPPKKNALSYTMEDLPNQCTSIIHKN